jgi:hypothetical protein
LGDGLITPDLAVETFQERVSRLWMETQRLNLSRKIMVQGSSIKAVEVASQLSEATDESN